MDIARTITDLAADLYKSDCHNHSCKIEVSMIIGRYQTEIDFISLSQSVIIRYKTMEYKVSRSSSADFELVCKFILDQIAHELSATLSGEDVDNDFEHPEYNIISLKKNNDKQPIFEKNILFRNFKENVLEYMIPLRFMN